MVIAHGATKNEPKQDMPIFQSWWVAFRVHHLQNSLSDFDETDMGVPVKNY